MKYTHGNEVLFPHRVSLSDIALVLVEISWRLNRHIVITDKRVEPDRPWMVVNEEEISDLPLDKIKFVP
jgi:hypothetical protein